MANIGKQQEYRDRKNFLESKTEKLVGKKIDNDTKKPESRAA